MEVCLVIIGTLIISSHYYVEGCNIFPTLSLKELNSVFYWATKKNDHVIDTYLACNTLPLKDAMFRYCLKKLTNVTDPRESYRLMGKDPCLIQELYYCEVDNIHCLNTKDFCCGMGYYEKCLKKFYKEHCKHHEGCYDQSMCEPHEKTDNHKPCQCEEKCKDKTILGYIWSSFKNDKINTDCPCKNG